MTAKEARVEAVRLWGRFGAIQTCASGSLCVGVMGRDLKIDAKGFGQTWEEAFANAERAERNGGSGS